MKERPILFSAPMVRAILDGSKTQTRRIMKPQPGVTKALMQEMRETFPGRTDGQILTSAWLAGFVEQNCRHGHMGDRLWVKETWRPSVVHSHGMDACDCGDVAIRYHADGATRNFTDWDLAKLPRADEWTIPKAAARGNVSPLLMPRWASRITLEITDVRVQRLQDISEEDARAEGCKPCPLTSVLAFAELWDSINGECAWDTNPWVWALTFRRVQP